MAKNFYISDLHLYHKEVLKGGYFHERPFETMEEMLSVIKDRWNAAVTNADTVYLLGDLAYKVDPATVAEYLSGLKGNIVLVCGNHDNIRDQRLRKQFREICDYRDIADNIDGNAVWVVMSHYPIYSWKGMFRGAVHLYGHVHDNEDERLYQEAIAKADEFFLRRDGEHHKPFRAVNVGCMMDYIDYTPRTLKEILTGRGMLI